MESGEKLEYWLQLMFQLVIEGNAKQILDFLHRKTDQSLRKDKKVKWIKMLLLWKYFVMRQ